MSLTKMTKAEWEAKATALFGTDKFKWRFVCPACGSIQSVEDFKPYKEKGAKPSSAYCECLGRYAGGERWLDEKRKGPAPKGKRCDYAGYGLLHISPIIVINEDKETECFAFDEGENTLKL